MYEARINYTIEDNTDNNTSQYPYKDPKIVYSSMKEGYDYTMTDLRVKTEEMLEKYVEKMKEKIGDYTLYDYTFREVLYRKYYFTDIRLIVADRGEIGLEIQAKTEEALSKAWLIFKDIFDECDNELHIMFTHYYQSFGNVTSFSTEIKKEDVFADDKFVPYIDVNEMFSQFFKAKENILMFVGESGLGKSKLSALALKYMFDHPKEFDNSGFEDVVTVKSTAVLASDEFWYELMVQKPTLVIIDDLDFMLGARDEEIASGHDVQKNAFLNQFLSFSDGVIKSKTKFIITTNQDIDDIDPALLRKGRLFEIIQLRKLTRDECETIFRAECPEREMPKFEDEMLASDLSYTINSSKVQVKDYLKEKLQTRVLKVKKKKKLGL
jgi:hypothetical protein